MIGDQGLSLLMFDVQLSAQAKQNSTGEDKVIWLRADKEVSR